MLSDMNWGRSEDVEIQRGLCRTWSSWLRSEVTAPGYWEGAGGKQPCACPGPFLLWVLLMG